MKEEEADMADAVEVLAIALGAAGSGALLHLGPELLQLPAQPATQTPVETDSRRGGDTC